MPKHRSSRRKKQKKKKDGEVKAEAEKKRTRTQKRKASRNGRAEEWQLLAAEERLAKKLRSGKITTAQFSTGVRKATSHIIARDDANTEDDSMASDDDGDDAGMDARWLIGHKKKGKKKGSFSWKKMRQGKIIFHPNDHCGCVESVVSTMSTKIMLIGRWNKLGSTTCTQIRNCP